jgi:hypothetical protein
MKQYFRSNYQHLVAFGIFLIIVLAYFSPQFDGQSLEQGDVTQYVAAANESYWFKGETGEEQLWSNSMFGGMPTTQTTLIHPGNFIGRSIMNFINWFPAPGGMVFLHLLCFYILLLCFRVNKWVAIIGAIGFAFATYEIVILGAGHNSKSLAVAFMAPVVGGFYMAYRHKFWLGIGLSSLFMAMEVSCNHLQVTYYLGILLAGLGIGELIRAIQLKNIKPFIKSSVGLVAVYLVALAVNYGNISMTNEYAAKSTRGGNDLMLTPSGEENKRGTEGGLDKDYITYWSYGVGESFTLLSPYVKGGATKVFADTPHADIIDNLGLSGEERNIAQGYPVYWGEQPGTAGPVYVGVIMIFLAFLGMIFLKDPIKWPLLFVGIIALMLSWGKNFMGFTEFWLEYVPSYNKFRTVTIILVLIELIVPLIAVLFLNMLIKQREAIVEQKKKVSYAAGGFLVFLVLVKMVGLGDNYTSQEFDMKQMDKIESQIMSQLADADPAQVMAQIQLDVNNPAQVQQFVEQRIQPYEQNLQYIKMAREEVFHSSMNRSIIFTLFCFGALALILFTSTNVAVGIGIIGLLSVVDLMGVSTNYLSSNESFWTDTMLKKYPFSPQNVDYQIMQIETSTNPELKAKVDQAEQETKQGLRDEEYQSLVKNRLVERERFATLNANTNYRVFDYTGGFNSARSSYYNKSLGGYHGAKLRTIQNMFEFHVGNSNNAVFDILNVKYFFQGGKEGLVLRQNPTAMGPVWLVNDLEVVDSRDEEIRAMGKIFQLKNIGKGSLIVNGEVKSAPAIRGFEDLKYIQNGDTLNVPLSNGIRKGLKVLFVMDVYGKTNLVPEMTITNDTANSFTQLVAMEVVNEFVPSQTAFIAKDNAKGIKKSTYSGAGEVKMDSYSPMKIAYTSSSDAEQFAVFSEMYYDLGWTATVNGKEAEIYNVNYCLRGLQLPKGKNKIEFVYDSSAYESSNSISFALCCFVLALVGFTVWKQKKEDQNTAVDSADEGKSE